MLEMQISTIQNEGGSTLYTAMNGNKIRLGLGATVWYYVHRIYRIISNYNYFLEKKYYSSYNSTVKYFSIVALNSSMLLCCHILCIIKS